MSEFTVTWTIEVDGDTAEEAAKQACSIMLDRQSMATVFQVKDQQGVTTEVDLLGSCPVIMTEDGYTFYRQSDGSYTDHIDPEQVDMRFDNLEQIKEAVSFGVIDRLSPSTLPKKRHHPQDLKIAVVIEGGIIQAIVSDQPSRLPDYIRVIDYDDGWEA